MAARNAALMNVLARDYVWARVLSSTPTAEREVLERLPARISKIGDAVAAAERDVMVGATARRHGLGSLLGDAAGEDRAQQQQQQQQQGHHGSDASLAEAARAGASGVAAEGALAAAELAGEALRSQAATALKVKFFCGCATPAGAPPPAVVAAATLSVSGLASTLELASAQAVRATKPG
jgi:hypothetical protein